MTASKQHVVAAEDQVATGGPTSGPVAERLLEQLRTTAEPAARSAAYERLVAMDLPLVETIAARYRGKGTERDDLVQVASLGLCKAICGYQADRGPSFLAHAVPTITGELKRYYRDLAWNVRPPRRLQELQLELRECEAVLTQRLGHPPSEEELAAASGIEQHALREVRVAEQVARTVSVEALGETSGRWAEARLPSSDDFAATEARLVLLPAVRALTLRERKILWLRFVQGSTQKEIGAALGVSQMQVSRLLEQILTKLRSWIVPWQEAG